MNGLRGIIFKNEPFHKICAKAKWIPEIRSHDQDASIILVGTQADLRKDVRHLSTNSRLAPALYQERIFLF